MTADGRSHTTTAVVHGEAVSRALAARTAVVALETTLVTHGLPHADGVAVAVALEEDVRAGGAVPATIGVLDGAVHVGLSREQLERLASTPGVVKLNVSNLAAAVAAGRSGSTTVAATMYVAHASGIAVFATGGIGGVHRGDTGDVSADLTALSRIPVAVVCAGAKAMLDLARTVEMLETLGVPVLGMETNDFPAFYRRSSGLPVDWRFGSIADLARAVRAHFALRTGTGVLVVNPISPSDELPEDVCERALGSALADAEARGLRGRDLTPFLLQRMHAVSGGASVRANVALLRNNARLAAALACELARHEPRTPEN